MTKSAKSAFVQRYWPIIGAAVCLAGAIASPFLLRLASPDDDPATLAQLAEWIGGTSAPLLGLAGLLIVLGAFLLQKDELQISRRELKAQREELELTRKEFHEQNATLRMQRFENTFFSLLRFHHDIVEKLGRSDESSRQFFGRIYGLLEDRQIFDVGRKNRGEVAGLSDSDLFIQTSYPEVFREQQADLGHYFRNLYHIMRFIHTSPIVSDEQRQFYARVVRAQLSAHELVLLFYNALPPSKGYPRFKFLIDHYDLLQNLDHSLLRDPEHGTRYNNVVVGADPFHAERAEHDQNASPPGGE